jgi:hypothetical protein
VVGAGGAEGGERLHVAEFTNSSTSGASVKWPTIGWLPETKPRIAGMSRAATSARASGARLACFAPPKAGAPAVRSSNQAMARLIVSTVRR